jgi:hypothetical protein
MTLCCVDVTQAESGIQLVKILVGNCIIVPEVEKSCKAARDGKRSGSGSKIGKERTGPHRHQPNPSSAPAGLDFVLENECDSAPGDLRWALSGIHGSRIHELCVIPCITNVKPYAAISALLSPPPLL